DISQYNYRYLGKVLMKGKQKPMDIYEFFDGETTEMIAQRLATKTEFDLAIENYLNKKFEEAQKLFQKIISINKSDKAALLYYNQCQFYIENGAPEGWDGTHQMKEK
ncbi:MAG: hypothetical protein HRT68_15975, partial [Flavobacteriaceae bacterium]|nr:hypothetical protein [Flavobacteriaceae bacterium]